MTAIQRLEWIEKRVKLSEITREYVFLALQQADEEKIAFAKLKCDEMSKEIAEKAEVNVDDYNGNTGKSEVCVKKEHFYEDRSFHDITVLVDKQSILSTAKGFIDKIE